MANRLDEEDSQAPGQQAAPPAGTGYPAGTPADRIDDDDDDEERREQAQAMAEVNMAYPRGQQHQRAEEEALMGAGGNEVDGIAGYAQAVDESGTLVQQRFLQFLGSLYVDLT